MKSCLVILALLAAVCTAQHPCWPNPPQNLRVSSLTSHSIEVEFEDPDNIQDCPIGSYHYEIEKVPIGSDIGSEIVKYSSTPDRTHSHDFLLLHSETVYKISVTAISTFDDFSRPATIEAETLK